MNIPEEAIAAAAEAMWARYGAYNPAATTMADEPKEYRNLLRLDARIALEAGMPFIVAKACGPTGSLEGKTQ